MKLILLAIAVLMIAAEITAQTTPSAAVVLVTTNPAGACTPPLAMRYNYVANTFWGCDGTWSGASLPVGPIAYSGAFYLRSYRAYTALLEQGVANTVLTVMHLGDSWTEQAYWTGPLDNWLISRYGISGAGFLSVSGINEGRQFWIPSGCSITPAGSWTYTHGSSGNFGPDMSDSTSTDTATPATQSMACGPGNTQAVLYYLKQSGGGSFTWKLNGGSPTTVSTANGSTALGTVTISGMSNTATNTVLTTVTVAGSGVDILGIDWQNPTQSGVHIVNIGQGGTQASTWTGRNQTVMQAEITQIAPALTTIMFGVNELNANVAPSALAANVVTLAGDIHTAQAGSDILFQTPVDIGLTGTYTMSQYASAMDTQSQTSNWGFINSVLSLPSYATGNALGLYTNTSHINANGGQLVSDLTRQILSEAAYTAINPQWFAVQPISGNTAYTAIYASATVAAAPSPSNYTVASNTTNTFLNGATESCLSEGGSTIVCGVSAGAQVFGHLLFKASVSPTIGSGFGTSPAIAGKDGAGRITVGSGGSDTTGVVSFSTTWATAPACVANDETTTLLVKATATTTQLTLTSATAWTAADTLTWLCTGY